MHCCSKGESPQSLTIFFIPWFATGHLISMVDIARLFASRGVTSTLLVTPANAALINISAASAPNIRIITYPFPTAESGLPPGVENLASLPRDDTYKIDVATPHARPAIERLLRLHRPNAVVADVHFGWTASVARDLRIPNLIFHALGLFPICVLHSLPPPAAHDTSVVLVPGLPHEIRIARSELPEPYQSTIPELSNMFEEMVEAEASSMGVVVNSLSGIESDYAEHFYRTKRLRSWFVGPVCLSEYRNDQLGESTGAWLDDKTPGSVVYVCFGSWPHFSEEQMAEISSALESCGHDFLWVVREGYETPPPRYSNNKGMVVRGWAPQVAILNHRAVGGFVTHCGWNSLLEGVAAGVPMVTWPLSTEQFVNERLVVDVLRIGVKNWEGFRTTVEAKKVTVNGGDFGKSVRKIMDADEEAEGMRKRAKEYGEMARAAVKQGGPSYDGLSNLINEIIALAYKG